MKVTENTQETNYEVKKICQVGENNNFYANWEKEKFSNGLNPILS